MQCTGCTAQEFTKAEWDRHARELYRCNTCGRRIPARAGSTLTQRVPRYRFPDDIIALAVR
jgi:transposase-like protein